MPTEKNQRICPEGHSYFKSSDCPVCPVCEAGKIPTKEFMAIISNPARRALESINITSLEQLAAYSEKEILSLHGMGPNAAGKLRNLLISKGLSFRKN